MKIVIAGDTVPTKTNFELFIRADMQTLLGKELSEYLSKADYKILNLETSLCNNMEPILKSGPHLIAPTSTIKGLKALGINLVTLANNHIMDQGAQGARETINALDSVGIGYVGFGDNLSEAKKPHIASINGIKIGIYACAEHEFSIAKNNRPGANPFDPLFSLDHIANLKNESDYLIVLYHGGREMYRYPSPELQRTCRRIVDKGADAVICQHSHSIGCAEYYKDSYILYGQGNFIFDANDNEYWNNGLIVVIDLDNDLNSKIELIPIVKHSNTICLPDEETRTKILYGFQQRSEILNDPEKIISEYQKYTKSIQDEIFSSLIGKMRKRFYFKALNKIFRHKLWKLFFDKSSLLYLENCLNCEAHREIITECIRNQLDIINEV